MELDIRKKLGNEIRSLRESNRLTTEQLAELSGVSRTTITKIELGKWSAGIDLIEKIVSPIGGTLIIKKY